MTLNKIILFGFASLLLLSIISCTKQILTEKKEIQATAEQPVQNPEDLAKVENENMIIYEMNYFDKNNRSHAFVSVSDQYYDSLSIPPNLIKDQNKIPFEKLSSFPLDKIYRSKMLKALHLSEDDSLFIYNYDKNELKSFQLKNLEAVASLSSYIDQPGDIMDIDYQLGFDIENVAANNLLYDKYRTSFIALGKSNPFATNKMVDVKWKKSKNVSSVEKYFPKRDFKESATYQFENGDFIFYVKDYYFEINVVSRKLIVLDRQNKLVFENMYQKSEGSEFTELSGTNKNYNTQWTGVLFKGKPPVIFGFQSPSFGCSVISVLDRFKTKIPLNCDNRH